MRLFLATLAVAAAVAAGEPQFEDDASIAEDGHGSLGLIEDVGVSIPGVVVLPSGHHMDLAVHRALRRLHSRGLAAVPPLLEQAWEKLLPEDFEDAHDEQGEGDQSPRSAAAAGGKSAAWSLGSTPAQWWEFAASGVRRLLQRRGPKAGEQQGRSGAAAGAPPEADAAADAEIVANAACDIARGAGEGHVVAMAALGEMALFLSRKEWPPEARERAAAVLTAASQAYIRRGPGHGHPLFGCDLGAAEALETLQRPPLGAWDDPILPTRLLRTVQAHLAGSPGGNAALDALRDRGVASDAPGVDPTAVIGPSPAPLALDTAADAILLLEAAFRIGRAGFVYTKEATRAAQAAAEAAGVPGRPKFGIAAFPGQLDSSVTLEVMPGANLPAPMAQSILAYLHAGGLLAVLDEARVGPVPLLRGRQRRKELATSLSNQGSSLAALLSGRRLANSLAGIGPEPVPEAAPAKREAVCSAALAVYMRLADETVRSEDVNAAQQSSGLALWELHENANAAAETAERARSRQYYEELEAQGDVAAADALGQMYFNGDHAAGVAADMGAALRHFQRAAQLGSGAGHANMAMMHLNALGWDQEAEGAEEEGGDAEEAAAEDDVDVDDDSLGNGPGAGDWRRHGRDLDEDDDNEEEPGGSPSWPWWPPTCAAAG